jgi:hypothetical protein
VTTDQGAGLTVDLVLIGYRLSGTTYQVSEKIRFGDVLNSQAERITLKRASISGFKGQALAALPEVTIEKQAIVAAIPRESDELQHKQRLYRAGMAKPDLVRVPMLALVPPYAAMGKIHVSPKSDPSDPEHSGLARFFPVTDAVLFREDVRLYQGPLLLLNRDLVAVMGKTGDEIREEPPSREKTLNEVLTSIVTTSHGLRQ